MRTAAYARLSVMVSTTEIGSVVHPMVVSPAEVAYRSPPPLNQMRKPASPSPEEQTPAPSPAPETMSPVAIVKENTSPARSARGSVRRISVPNPLLSQRPKPFPASAHVPPSATPSSTV